ncbi:nitroreductase family protein [Hornefia butyriciproducens]|uniref:nitroreductase family protein n=1 Tax=Hornefia butyriciproducens TaxID=2652293 RepID=UPI002A91B5C9|nr:nitroreductase family protein [Hornefia butyriciproducens]MCI7413144.1 nitroreductase family protein [Clostridiales bacterium]MDY6212130.1 nitroreductase family protein [Hornefia butyriciproducens]
METKDCILTRRSVRRFTDRPVPHETVRQMVSLAAYAPSWKNTQVTRYYAVEDQAVKEEIADNCVLGFESNAKIIRRCPVLMVITCKHGISGYEKSGEPTTGKDDRWEVFDSGIATQTFCLAAHDLGLGTVIMGIFDDDKVAETVGVSDGEIVAALVALGYPDGDPKAPPRKDADALLNFR